MRQLKFLWLLVLPLLLVSVANAQNVRIVYPQEGQDVRGEITARFEGIPAGGYALVKIDDQFRQASAQDSVVLDTISDRVTFARGDGPYKLEITVLNSGGKRLGTDSVTFNVANGKVEESGESVKLTHWIKQDRLAEVQRFRIFAESNASISGGSGGGSGGGGGGGEAIGAVAQSEYIPAPLDYQVSIFLRRTLRDANMFNGSANIATLVQTGFQRQRISEGGGQPASAAPIGGGGGPKKAPWNPSWSPAAETGKYFVKAIRPSGTEINTTRKPPGIALSDLLPTFPDEAVRPGSTWETTMSLIGDLSTRLPINVKAPITFTAYEDLQSPAGESRRCAKLESRFSLPDNLAKRIAANLANKVGGGGAAPAAAPPAPGDPAAASLISEADILVARTDMARVLWFDVQRRRILRVEDTIRSNFEVPTAAVAAPAPEPGAGGDAAALPAEPTKVSYNLKVTSWLDDRIPNPTGQYVAGGAKAHARDSVTDPGLSRALRPSTPAP